MIKPTLTLFSTKIQDLKSAKKEWSKRLLQAPRAEGFQAFAVASSAAPDQNVVGVAVGEQLVGDIPTGVMAVKFFVRVKYLENELIRKHLLPKTIDGLPVDVEETGLFRRLKAPALPNPKTKFRPAQPGCSVGFRYPNDQYVMAGTFGALVKDNSGQYILSNSHVLANEGQLPSGADIFQPGLLDDGDPKTDLVANLTRFIPFSTTGNQVDCAIAKATSNGIVSNSVLHIGPPSGTAPATIDMSVHKFGRTTSYTVGRITSIDADITVPYDTGNFTFHEQITIKGTQGTFSRQGDSGSLIMERGTNRAVGLLFAGSGTLTVANHISEVLAALKVTLA